MCDGPDMQDSDVGFNSAVMCSACCVEDVKCFDVVLWRQGKCFVTVTGW